MHRGGTQLWVSPCLISRRSCCSHDLGVKPTQSTFLCGPTSDQVKPREAVYYLNQWTPFFFTDYTTWGEAFFCLTYLDTRIFTYVLILELLEGTKTLPFILLIYFYVQFIFLFIQFFKPLDFFTVKFILWERIYSKG